MAIIQTTLPKPVGLQSYLDEQGKNQIFYWPITVNEDYLPKDWDIFLSGSYNWSSYGWVAEYGSTGSLAYNSFERSAVITCLPGQKYFVVPADWKILNTDITAVNSIGNSVELYMKYNNPGTISSRFELCVFDGTRYTMFYIYRNRITFGLISYYMDTTSDYHRYLITCIGNIAYIYVDGQLVAQGEPPSVTGRTWPVEFGLNTNNLTVNTGAEIKYLKIANKPFLPVNIDIIDYTIQIDTSDTFTSPNLKEYTFSQLNDSYHSGALFGFVNSLPDQQLDSAYSFYWRIKVNCTAYISEWSDVQTFTLDKNKKNEIFQRIIDSILDDNIYSKDYASSNIASLLNSEASEVNIADFSIIRAVRDLSFLEGRDSTMGTIGGVLFGVDRGSFTNTIDYRNFLKDASVSFANGTTLESVNTVVKSIVGIEPQIVEQKDITSWQIFDSTSHTGTHFYLKDSAYPGLRSVIRLFSRKGKAFTWQLHVFNPYGVVYNREMIEELINKLKPAHTEVYFIYYDSEGAVLINPYYYGRAYYGEALYTDKRRTV